MDYILLGQRIRRYRQEKNLTQEQLAELVGISPSFLGHIERGSRIASLETVMKFCEVLDVTPNRLLSNVLQPDMALPETITLAPQEFLQEVARLLSKYENP